MHELSLSSAILNTAIKHAAGRKVTVVRVRVGALRQVVPGALEFYFTIVARDGLCEGARLELEHVPARGRCGECGAERELDAPRFRCELCGAALTILTGEEFEVESLDVEEVPCITSR